MADFFPQQVKSVSTSATSGPLQDLSAAGYGAGAYVVTWGVNGAAVPTGRTLTLRFYTSLDGGGYSHYLYEETMTNSDDYLLGRVSPVIPIADVAAYSDLQFQVVGGGTAFTFNWQLIRVASLGAAP